MIVSGIGEYQKIENRVEKFLRRKKKSLQKKALSEPQNHGALPLNRLGSALSSGPFSFFGFGVEPRWETSSSSSSSLLRLLRFHGFFPLPPPLLLPPSTAPCELVLLLEKRSISLIVVGFAVVVACVVVVYVVVARVVVGAAVVVFAGQRKREYLSLSACWFHHVIQSTKNFYPLLNVSSSSIPKLLENKKYEAISQNSRLFCLFFCPHLFLSFLSIQNKKNRNYAGVVLDAVSSPIRQVLQNLQGWEIQQFVQHQNISFLQVQNTASKFLQLQRSTLPLFPRPLSLLLPFVHLMCSGSLPFTQV